jgi:NitT/TauT family transport system substrate-binding protein
MITPAAARFSLRSRALSSMLSLALAAAVALGVAAAPAPARAADLKPYRVGFNAWIGSIAFFVAREKGFFKEEGLDLQDKSFSSPGDGLPPLLTGDLDAVLSTADSVITVLDKAPGQLRVVYLTDTSSGADAILAKKDIGGIKAMKGRKVAATLGQCNQLLLEKALEKAGLTDADIQLVNMNPDDAGSAFAAGKIDVAVTWEPWITKVSGEKKGHVIFSSKETPNLILDVLAISAKTAQKKPAETRAFLKALNRGYDFVQKHTDEAAALAAKALEQKPDEVKAMLPKVKLYSPKQNLEVMAGPAASATAQVAQFFKDKKVNETLVDVSHLYDPSFLK